LKDGLETNDELIYGIVLGQLHLDMARLCSRLWQTEQNKTGFTLHLIQSIDFELVEWQLRHFTAHSAIHAVIVANLRVNVRDILVIFDQNI
jgi:hypothetical protein